MKLKRKKVVVLLCGGTSLIDGEGSVREVRTAKDVTAWMQLLPELNLIATLEPVFLSSGATAETQPTWWQTIAKTIADRFDEADGFLVTQAVDMIPHTAAALSLMLQHIGKPVIVTGSPELPPDAVKKRKIARAWRGNAEIGIRANLVNAVQVATLDLGEVAVLFGNRLVRGGAVLPHTEPSLNVFESAGVAPIGRVDFGLKLEPHRRRRTGKAPKLSTSLKTKILQLTLAPTTMQPLLSHLSEQGIDGILIGGQPSSSEELLGRVLELTKGLRIPVAIYSQWPMKTTRRFVTITNVTPATALVKFMWALGQTRDPKQLQRLLAADVAGENIRLHDERP